MPELDDPPAEVLAEFEAALDKDAEAWLEAMRRKLKPEETEDGDDNG